MAIFSEKSQKSFSNESFAPQTPWHSKALTLGSKPIYDTLEMQISNKNFLRKFQAFFSAKS